VLPTFLILNPRSGSGKNERLIPLIRDHFRLHGIPFDFHVTTFPDDGRRVANEVKKDYPIIVAGGGDGTVNEVVNGIAGFDSILGVLPLGSGNDFANTVLYPKRFKKCLEVLTKQQVRTIDFGSIEVVSSCLERKRKHFINSVGIGLDAEVANEAGKISWAHGIAKYALAALKVLIRYNAKFSRVSSLEFESEGKHLLISIGNGRSSGGGFYLTPQALLDDGLLDVCIAKDLSMPEILKIFPFVLVGKHAGFRKIDMRRTKKLIVKSETNLPVHVDGEIMGLDIHEVSVEIIPRGMKILTP
jgi:YegS/Rv2252/BmrU family lipid kinase